MWFRNALLYRISDNAFNVTAEELEDHLQSRPARPCGSQEVFTLGFTHPFGRHSESFVQVANKAFLVALRKEERILPGSVVKDALSEKVEEIENRDGRKVYKKEKDTLKDEIILNLLPRAFTRSSVTLAVIDMQERLIYVDAASAKKAEDLLSLMREIIGTLPVRPVSVKVAPTSSMTEWVKGENVPESLYALDSATLVDTSEDGGKIAATRQDLGSEEIQQHLQAGKIVSELSLAYEDKMTFKINDHLAIKSIRFEDVLMDEADDQGGDDMAGQLDAQLHIMVGAFRELIPVITDAFGGEDIPQGI